MNTPSATVPAWAGLSALIVWVIAIGIWAHYRGLLPTALPRFLPRFRFPGWHRGRAGFRPRSWWRPLLSLGVALAGLAAATPAARGQDTTRIRRLVRADSIFLDSIARDKSAPQYSKRNQTRIRAAGDSILQAMRAPAPVPPPVDTVTRAATVEIHSNGTSVAVGSTLQASAEVRSATGQVITRPVTWIASPIGTATVSSTGLITAKAAGTVRITARADTASGRRDYLVTGVAPIPPPDSTPTTPPTPPDTTGAGGMIGVAAVAELPRVLPPSTYPNTGRAVRVPLVGNLQFYLDNAVSGDVLLLPAGSSYIGNFVLRDKGPAQSWIVVRTDTTLSTAGRMTPSAAQAARLARILTPNNVPAIGTEHGAHHWVFAGVEVSITPTADETNGIVRIGGAPGQTTLAQMAHDVILDRVWIHGTLTQAVRRCVSLQGGAAAVLDSWVDDCHTNNGDSQAIVSWDGTGPFLIRNNHLAAGHENIMFGGADPGIQGVVPSDVTITGNHITKPAAWIGKWQFKNLVETKNVRRMLMEGNVIENIKPDAQAGFGLLIKSVNQSGGCPWCVSEHITVRFNIIRAAANGINLAGVPQGPAVAANHITFVHNLLDTVNVSSPWTGGGGAGIPLQILGNMADVAFAHNTIAGGTWGLLQFDGAPNTRVAFAANAMYCGGYGVKGSDAGGGVASLEKFAPGYSWNSNALFNCSGGYPSSTAYFGTRSQVTGTAADGLPYGADMARIKAATAGAVVAP